MRANLPSFLRTLSFRDQPQRRFVAWAAAACLVDLASKEMAVRALGSTGVVALTDRLALMLVWNTGSVGGNLVSAVTWQLSALVTALAVGLVFTVVGPIAAVDRRATVAFGLVTGGAIGNLASMMAGPPGVADFIGIRLTPETTMVANVADFALWTGAVLLAPVFLTLVRLVRADRAVVRTVAPLA
ncbi:MAG: signal peptidase II [Gemmatimonadaceae bacterium]